MKKVLEIEHTDRQQDKQRDRQMNRNTSSYTDTLTDQKTHTKIKKQTKKTLRYTERQQYQQTHPDKLTDGSIDTHKIYRQSIDTNPDPQINSQITRLKKDPIRDSHPDI